MSMLPEYPSDPIAYLVRRRFGDAELTGPVSGLLEDEEETQTQLYAAIETYRAELQVLEEEQLFARAYQEREKEAHELKELEEQTPFYNRQNAQADFKYWAKVPLWTLDEAVALSFGKNPFLVTWSAVEEYADTSSFAAGFANLRHLVLRAKEAQQLPELVSPDAYIAWAKANNVAFPRELEESVNAFSGQEPDYKALFEETKLQLASATDEVARLKAADKPLGGKERNTYHKLLLGLAVACYKYDPSALRSTTAKAIVEDLACLNISIDEDTVREKLREAAEEFGDRLPRRDER